MITIDRVNELLSYDPETGMIFWKVKRQPAINPGDIAGFVCKAVRSGYRLIKIDGRHYQAHRLAWFITHGEFPPCGIDHFNRIRTDNRISNLRLATSAENSRNSAGKNNKTGLKGVSYMPRINRYIANIMVNGKTIYLGCHKDAELAGFIYDCAAEKYHGKFNYRNAESAP